MIFMMMIIEGRTSVCSLVSKQSIRVVQIQAGAIHI